MLVLKERGTENTYYCGLVFARGKKSKTKKSAFLNVYPYSTQDLGEARKFETRESAEAECKKVNEMDNISYEVHLIDHEVSKKELPVLAYAYKSGVDTSTMTVKSKR